MYTQPNNKFTNTKTIQYNYKRTKTKVNKVWPGHKQLADSQSIASQQNLFKKQNYQTKKYWAFKINLFL